MTLVFVGEKRSRRAIQMGVTWDDGHLAAKTLFDALAYAGIIIEECIFTNLWTDDGELRPIPQGTIIGMGRKVQAQLERMGIQHIKLIHPAARGAIRKRAAYHKHVKTVLKGVLA